MVLKNVSAVVQSKIDLLNFTLSDHIMEEIALPPPDIRVQPLFLKPSLVIQCLEMLRPHSNQNLRVLKQGCYRGAQRLYKVSLCTKGIFSKILEIHSHPQNLQTSRRTEGQISYISPLPSLYMPWHMCLHMPCMCIHIHTHMIIF